MEGKESTGANSAELSNFVQSLLQQMQGRFQKMSENIMARMDDMGSKIEELEKSITDLVDQTGVEEPATASKT